MPYFITYDHRLPGNHGTLCNFYIFISHPQVPSLSISFGSAHVYFVRIQYQYTEIPSPAFFAVKQKLKQVITGE